MRLCEVLASDEEGGLENHFFDLANVLAKKHEVHVIAHPRFADRFDESVAFHPLDLSGSRKNPLTLYQLYRTVQGIEPDLLHAHANKTAAMIAILKRFIRCPCVATIHSLKRKTAEFECFDHLIAVSKGVAAKIQNPSLSVIYNGRDIAPSRQEKSSQAADDKLIITMIGRLVDVKGVDVLLAAFSQLSNTQAELRLVGDGVKRKDLEAQAEQLGIDGRVSFLGTRDDIELQLQQSDLVVISSRREGFPLVLVEALLCHRPVVSTKVPGASEILPAEVLAETEDAKALAEKLNWALADRSRLAETFAPVYSFAEQELTLTNQIAKTEQVLLDVVQRESVCKS